jgi:hypothetical protein
MANQKNSPTFDQPMLEAFTPVEGIDYVDEAKQAEVAAHIAAVAKDRLPIEPRISEAFADLGGGTSESATEEPSTTRRTRQRRPHINRRGGRSYSEGTDSELDPHWTESAPEVPQEEREKAQDFVEEARLNNATRNYLKEVAEGDARGALARLRTKGFRPDPETNGTTVIRLDEPSKIHEGK